MAAKATRTYQARVAAGLCRDCQRPRGDGGTAHRCGPCAAHTAAHKAHRRRFRRDLFASLAAHGAPRPEDAARLRAWRRRFAAARLELF